MYVNDWTIQTNILLAKMNVFASIFENLCAHKKRHKLTSGSGGRERRSTLKAAAPVLASLVHWIRSQSATEKKMHEFKEFQSSCFIFNCISLLSYIAGEMKGKVWGSKEFQSICSIF